MKLTTFSETRRLHKTIIFRILQKNCFSIKLQVLQVNLNSLIHAQFSDNYIQ